MNRRGEEAGLKELIAIVFAVMIISIPVGVLYAKTDSTAFFQEFQGKDIGLFLETASASPGDLIATYSNIKNDEDLRYEFNRGETKVHILETVNGIEAVKVSQAYGTYEKLGANSLEVINPAYLVVVKSEDLLTVKEDVTFRSSCKYEGDGIVQPKVYLEGAQTFAILTEARKILPARGEEIFNENEGDEIFILDVKKPGITIYAKGLAETYLGCLFKEQLETFTHEEIVILPHQENKVTIQANVESVGTDVLGKAIGRGVLIYAQQ